MCLNQISLGVDILVDSMAIGNSQILDLSHEPELMLTSLLEIQTALMSGRSEEGIALGAQDRRLMSEDLARMPGNLLGTLQQSFCNTSLCFTYSQGCKISFGNSNEIPIVFQAISSVFDAYICYFISIADTPRNL